MPLHSALTDPEIHEPKGASTALENQVYHSNGLGSGNWRRGAYTLCGVIDDVSTASSIYLAVPYAGTVTKVVTVLAGALTTGNSTVTVRNAAAASMGTLTITQSGSAAGDIDVLEPVSNNVVTADSRILVETDGGSDTTRKLFVTVYIQGS